MIVHELSRVLDETLRTLVPKRTRCALVGFPDHSNVGDSAIWLGEQAFLAKLGAEIVYTCSTGTYAEGELRARLGEGMILIHGGGNLGDLWPEHQALREQVVGAFRSHRIVQLPQSIWFDDRRNVARARAVFDQHPDFTILARDAQSLELARSNFEASSLLCPDMAFALGPLDRSVGPIRDILCLLRSDKESRAALGSALPADAVAVDWLEDRSSARLWLANRLSRGRVRRALDQRLPTLERVRRRVWNGLAAERVARGCALLGQGRVVVSDRLHAHILSLLLGIEHVVLDNSYGKLASFYRSWTSTSELTHWATSLEEAIAVSRALIEKARR